MRLSFLYAVLIVTGAIFGLYQVKYMVRDVKGRVSSLEREMKKEQNALHVLKAEWAYLNRPDRLQRLSQKHLPMTPLSGTQLVNVKTLPPAIALRESPILPASVQVHE